LADVIEALLIHNPLKALEEGNLEMVSYQLNALNDSINNSTRTLFILGFIYFISTTLECLSFSIYSERLTINMRVKMF
jgi:ATP-binding cassette subfamily B (MDR/TAP) protein 1